MTIIEHVGPELADAIAKRQVVRRMLDASEGRPMSPDEEMAFRLATRAADAAHRALSPFDSVSYGIWARSAES